MRVWLAALLCACGGASMRPASAPPTWTALESGTTESLRGLSMVSAEIVWASGTHGTVVRAIDGRSFARCATPPNAETLDLRSLHAIDATHALVLSAGSPARLFATSDGCASWTEEYAREGEGVFFDSLVVRTDGDGLAIGDPLPSTDGARFPLLVTHDGGASWEPREGPLASEGEAAFAASNGCIAALADGAWLFATSAARVFRSDDRGSSWSSASVPMATSASAGVFAIAFRDARVGFAVGGDYAAPSSAGGFARTRDGGRSWEPGASPRGYRSSIAMTERALVVVGTSGSDVSYDGGASWIVIDDTARNSVRAIGDIVIAAGPDGRIDRLRL